MQPPSTVLDWYLGYFHCFLSHDLGMPMWSHILITEQTDEDAVTASAVIGDLVPFDAFRKRFSELTSKGWPWINLHAMGLSKGRLILSIEVPAYPPGNAPITSVNLSGPSHSVIKNGFEINLKQKHH